MTTKRYRSGPEQAQRVMRKLATNPLKQVMFGVEAEMDGHGGAVLTVVDINERRNLYHKYGQHNVRVSMQDMVGLGFPRRALAVLQKGYPIRIGMPIDAYEGLLTSGGFSGLEGRYDDDDEEDADVWQCQMCGGPVVPMGTLGNRFHGRCRNCGMMMSRVLGEDEGLETIEWDLREEKLRAIADKHNVWIEDVEALIDMPPRVREHACTHVSSFPDALPPKKCAAIVRSARAAGLLPPKE